MKEKDGVEYIVHFEWWQEVAVRPADKCLGKSTCPIIPCIDTQLLFMSPKTLK